MSTTEPTDPYYVRLFNMACSKIVTYSDVTNKQNTESEHFVSEWRFTSVMLRINTNVCVFVSSFTITKPSLE